MDERRGSAQKDHSRGSAELATDSDFLMSAQTQGPGAMSGIGPAVGRVSGVPITDTIALVSIDWAK